MTPTARTLQVLRKSGYRAQVVEQTIPHTFIKRDLFGFVDIVAVPSSEEQKRICATPLLIQVTTGSNAAARESKIRGACAGALADCLAAGFIVEVWAWSKRKVKRGGRAVRWEPVTRTIRP